MFNDHTFNNLYELTLNTLNVLQVHPSLLCNATLYVQEKTLASGLFRGIDL